jgi:hypothetical protein
MNSEIEATLQTVLGTDLAQIISETQAIAGYELPPQARRGFLLFHQFITDPVPSYIAGWRASPTAEHWCQRHVNGVLGDVQNAVRRVFYHRPRRSVRSSSRSPSCTKSS